MATKQVSWMVAALLTLGAAQFAAAAVTRSGYIVEARDTASAGKAVRHVGGRVTHDLPIINGVSALLTPTQLDSLRFDPTVTLFADAPVAAQGNPIVDSYARAFVGANLLAAQGLFGNGVTVAILDSGVWYSNGSVSSDLNSHYKILAMYDAIAGVQQNTPDGNGHGSHIASIIGSADTSVDGQLLGIAPMAPLVAVKAFDNGGSANYANVVNGLNWILVNRSKYNIRVLNLSFGAKPQSFYWNDPIDQAVMKLWQAGVVVVASAGNFGPSPQTIAVPGNTPYVITVGAMTDNYTPANRADDGIASFSSTGPTFEGFVKPDVVAPGGHLPGNMDLSTMAIPKAHPEFITDQNALMVMSGTSQSAAVVSGAVALMLQAIPSLTPDQVKCRLMASAGAAVASNGKAAYSVFQQGAGLVNAFNALYSQAANCTNKGSTSPRTLPALHITAGNGSLWNQSSVAPASAPTATESWNQQE